MPIVIYAVGSPIVVDVEESCKRRRLEVAAAVKNVEGPCFVSADVPVVNADDVSADIKRIEFLIPLFTPANRQSALEDARSRGFSRAATLLDPTAVIASSTSVGAGTYVNSGVVIGGAGRVGDFVFINRSASIGHHVEIDAFASVGPGAVIGGNVRLGRGAMVGAGAVILPKLEIGANSVIGAGAVVTKPVPAHCVAVGNPARVTRTGIPGLR